MIIKQLIKGVFVFLAGLVAFGAMGYGLTKMLLLDGDAIGLYAENFGLLVAHSSIVVFCALMSTIFIISSSRRPADISERNWKRIKRLNHCYDIIGDGQAHAKIDKLVKSKGMRESVNRLSDADLTNRNKT